MKKIVYWFRNARMVALPQSVLPSVVAFCMATQIDGFSWILGVLAIFGVISAHLSVNLFDDYFDYINSNRVSREEMAGETGFVRVAKSPYLYSGEVSQRKLFIVASLFAATALAFGSAIFVKRGFVPLIIAAAGGFLGFFYSARPFKFCYRGLGEIVTGTIFGPLLMAGVFYAAAGVLTLNIRIVSAIVGILVINILFTHSIMDFNPDKKVGKKTLAGVLKSKKANLAASFLFIFSPYMVIISSVLCGVLTPAYLATSVALPRSIFLFYLLHQFYYNPERQFEKSWWLGPMENWDAVKENNLQWFAIRWYLSRNILQLFCLVFIVLCFL